MEATMMKRPEIIALTYDKSPIAGSRSTKNNSYLFISYRRLCSTKTDCGGAKKKD